MEREAISIRADHMDVSVDLRTTTLALRHDLLRTAELGQGKNSLSVPPSSSILVVSCVPITTTPSTPISV